VIKIYRQWMQQFWLRSRPFENGDNIESSVYKCVVNKEVGGSWFRPKCIVVTSDVNCAEAKISAAQTINQCKFRETFNCIVTKTRKLRNSI
jgi:hypothetical protein